MAYTDTDIDWLACELIEQIPGKVSGRPIVRTLSPRRHRGQLRPWGDHRGTARRFSLIRAVDAATTSLREWLTPS